MASTNQEWMVDSMNEFSDFSELPQVDFGNDLDQSFSANFGIVPNTPLEPAVTSPQPGLENTMPQFADFSQLPQLDSGNNFAQYVATQQPEMGRYNPLELALPSQQPGLDFSVQQPQMGAITQQPATQQTPPLLWPCIGTLESLANGGVGVWSSRGLVKCTPRIQSVLRNLLDQQDQCQRNVGLGQPAGLAQPAPVATPVQPATSESSWFEQYTTLQDGGNSLCESSGSSLVQRVEASPDTLFNRYESSERAVENDELDHRFNNPVDEVQCVDEIQGLEHLSCVYMSRPTAVQTPYYPSHCNRLMGLQVYVIFFLPITTVCPSSRSVSAKQSSRRSSPVSRIFTTCFQVSNLSTPALVPRSLPLGVEFIASATGSTTPSQQPPP
ncbi:hypothetical protein K458DRAFT_402403 [Lentithecium fluviatile CBS 122367]|uniref:Uncharacterized protein n=1 Tax=Lentithecium fluviatile CBS 122367 TaxID=1168545 RepID=A0A6G1J9P9_9PLEO|nr:hypothetical protein K458DRAFT_402403 [Lentithecium fluviatile CBS 122367]